MDITVYAYRFRHYLLRFMQLQLFITLFSLPLIIAWGLPFSLLSPLGNLIFNPALSLFLLLASLIFFTELLYLPNEWLIYAFDRSTSWWLTFMHADSKTWLIGFAKPSPIILALVTMSCIGVMLCKKTNGMYQSIICFLIIFCLLVGYLRCIACTPSYSQLPCTKGSLHIITHNKETILIDPGYLNQSKSMSSWVQYTLIPHIITTTGKTAVEHVVLMQPGKTAFEALEHLSKKMTIYTVYIPYWKEKDEKILGEHFTALKKTLEKQGTRVVRLGDAAIEIGAFLMVSPCKNITTSKLAYRAYKAHTSVDNKDITLYSANYKINQTLPNRKSKTGIPDDQ